MSAFQLTSLIGVPLTVLLVTVALLVLARPDRDENDGMYAAYLAVACVFTLYLGLLALAGLGEAISQHLVVGTEPRNGAFDQNLGLQSYFSLITGGGASAIAAFATLTALMAFAFGYHARRRGELSADVPSPTVDRIARAGRAGQCFAMLPLVAIGGLVAGEAGYNFFAQPVTSSDTARDLAMGSFLTYGALVLIAGLVFRSQFWAIRGSRGDAEDPEPALADVEDV